MTERDEILGRVRDALAPLPQRAKLPDWEPELVQLRGRQVHRDGWEFFAERFQAVNGTPLSGVDQLLDLLEGHGARKGYCDPAIWMRLRERFPPTFSIETVFERARVDDYQFGITRAAGAIAETGTLILADQTTSSRLGALAPWIHVAVLVRQEIQPDVSAALAALPQDPNVVWITGPSKTADVEGILIEGVHGPGIQAALLLE